MESSTYQFPLNPFLAYSHDVGSDYYEYNDNTTNVKYYTDKQSSTTIYQDPITKTWLKVYPPKEKLASPPQNPFLNWGSNNGQGFSVFADRNSNRYYTNLSSLITYYHDQRNNKFVQIYPPDPPDQPSSSPQNPSPANSHTKTKTSSEVLNSISCSCCSQPNIDLFLPGCRHPYHISCFNFFCQICSREVKLPLAAKPDPNSCCKCSSMENLLSCGFCKKKYCFLCVHQKVLPECCSGIMDNLGNYSTVCPGCEYNLRYTEFLPFVHKSHSLLCKKCLMLGMRRKVCILGCQIREILTEIVFCNCCKINNAAYQGNFKCKNKCDVCFNCQWHEIIKQGEKKRCCYCDQDLVEDRLDY